MLISINIKDYLLIENLSLNFEDGLTILTGETGAGKSILIDALELVCGGRGDRKIIRKDQNQTSISASFQLPHSHEVFKLLDEFAIARDDDLIHLRRVLFKDGKNRAFVNDTNISISFLKQVGSAMLEIHGQNADQGFLSPKSHLSLLDQYASIYDITKEVSSLYDLIQDYETELDQISKDIETTKSLNEFHKNAIDEISKLKLLPDEENILLEKRNLLKKSAFIKNTISDLYGLFSSTDFFEKIGSYSRKLEQKEGQMDDFIELRTNIDNLIYSYDNLLEEIEDLNNNYTNKDDILLEIDDRLHLIRTIARKYNKPVSQLGEYLLQIENKYKESTELENLKKLTNEKLAKANSEYDKKSQSLSLKRHEFAQKLEDDVKKEISELKLGIAKFHVNIEKEAKKTHHGFDKVSFLISTNSGLDMGPLHHIASGGELSRFVLALKAALAMKESKTVIIFDEVDAGIGGSVAAAVGQRLFKLGQKTQIICITHSPQVASKAKHHYLVSKEINDTLNKSTIRKLSEKERIEEIARMLSGEEITDEARNAAISLIGAENE